MFLPKTECERCGITVYDHQHAAPARLNHLADEIATGNNMEALRILRELAGKDIPTPQQIISRCKAQGWNTITPDQGGS